MIGSKLFNDFLTKNIVFCYVFGLFYDIFECSMYYSYSIQAFYRLCRIVFYKKKYLVSHSLYIILIIIQWLLVLGFLVPTIFFHWYSRLPTEQYCIIPYTNIRAEIYHILLLYIIPIICITTTYIWITIFMHQRAQTSLIASTVLRRKRNERDLIVIKRIILLTSLLIILRFPTIIFIVYAVMSGNVFLFTYDIIGIFTSTCLIFIGISTIYTTPQLRKLVDILAHPNNRVHVEHIAMNPRGVSIATVGDTTITQKSKQKTVQFVRNP
ncbi:unnamed protein product [Rotaria sp. Silwood1]|nr:unnamed protein product [Rotaria sp. Silwood1]CAF5022438.1 unnamed protein product [Rotaria sp. Silwood1]